MLSGQYYVFTVPQQREPIGALRWDCSRDRGAMQWQAGCSGGGYRYGRYYRGNRALLQGLYRRRYTAKGVLQALLTVEVETSRDSVH